jgi:hypothetical protein
MGKFLEAATKWEPEALGNYFNDLTIKIQVTPEAKTEPMRYLECYPQCLLLNWTVIYILFKLYNLISLQIWIDS